MCRSMGGRRPLDGRGLSGSEIEGEGKGDRGRKRQQRLSASTQNNRASLVRTRF